MVRMRGRFNFIAAGLTTLLWLLRCQAASCLVLALAAEEGLGDLDGRRSIGPRSTSGAWRRPLGSPQSLQLGQDFVEPQPLDELHDVVVNRRLALPRVPGADAEDGHDVGVKIGR